MISKSQRFCVEKKKNFNAQFSIINYFSYLCRVVEKKRSLNF